MRYFGIAVTALGVIIFVLGLSVIQNPTLIVPLIAGVLFFFGALLFVIGLSIWKLQRRFFHYKDQFFKGFRIEK